MSRSAENLPLDTEAEKICIAAEYKATQGEEPRVLEWLLAAAELASKTLSQLYPAENPGTLRSRLREAIRRNDAGPSLSRASLLACAAELAREKHESVIRSEHIIATVLKQAAPLLSSAVAVEGTATETPTPREVVPPRTPPRRPSSSHEPPDGVPASERPIPVATSRPQPRHARRPTLESVTMDLTHAARQGKLSPVVGREAEIALVMETLCRVTQRNPALVGPAGVGKTAIAEGVAQRIAEGRCPDMLKGARIYALQPAAILAGTSSPMEYAERVRKLIEEASAPDVILFIDEFHSLMERGTAMEQDLVTLLKPALARGDIACIAATTDDEYRRIIESDTALARRFQAIRIGEMDPTQTLVVLEAHRERLYRERVIQVSDALLKRIIDVSIDRMPNRRLPDKAVSLLEQVVAHAVFQKRAKALPRDVMEVVERLTGTPGDPPTMLNALAEALVSGHLLSPADTEALCSHLRVSMAGLDIRPERPNAVILMLNNAASDASALSAVIAEKMAGSQERVVDMDFSTMVHPADITRLIGASPSYVGYGEELPIHALLQYPWSVFLCRNVDQCHPSIATTLLNSIRKGAIVDGMGRTIRLCDCVVVLTAGDVHAARGGTIGLRAREDAQRADDSPPPALKHEFLELATLVVREAVSTRPDATQEYIQQSILPALTKRYRRRGLEIEWDTGVTDWIVRRFRGLTSSEALEDKLAALLGNYLFQYLPESGTARVRVSAADNDLKVELISARRRRS